MDLAKPLSSSSDRTDHLSHDGELVDDSTFYRHTVGALQYITVTRPD